MMTAKELRRAAWKALGENGQYWRYLSAYMLMSLVLLVIMAPLISLMLGGIAASGVTGLCNTEAFSDPIKFLNPRLLLSLGCTSLVFSLLVIYPIGFSKWSQSAMAIAAMRRGIKVGHAFSGWGHGWKMGWIVLVEWAYLSLWALLVIPFFVKVFSYAMAEFVAVDHPDWSADECITESRRLMDGNKARYFCLLFSFVGWWILALAAASIIPFIGNIAQFMLVPYIGSAQAAFYEELLDSDNGE